MDPISVKPGQEFDIGPVSGTLSGVPTPLPDGVVFTVSSGPVVLAPIDPVTVTAKIPAGTPTGSGSVTVSCGSLSPVVVPITIVVPPPPSADTLVVPVGSVRDSA